MSAEPALAASEAAAEAVRALNHATLDRGAVRAEHSVLIARVEARAAADVQEGIANLRVEVARAAEGPRFVVSGKADGSRVLEPKRELLAAALRRVEAAAS